MWSCRCRCGLEQSSPCNEQQRVTLLSGSCWRCRWVVPSCPAVNTMQTYWLDAAPTTPPVLPHASAAAAPEGATSIWLQDHGQRAGLHLAGPLKAHLTVQSLQPGCQAGGRVTLPPTPAAVCRACDRLRRPSVCIMITAGLQPAADETRYHSTPGSPAAPPAAAPWRDPGPQTSQPPCRLCCLPRLP